MSRVGIRGRAARLVMAAAALVVVAVTGAFIAVQPANATWTSMSGTPTCDCVRLSEDGKSYQAFFGYDNPTKVIGTIERGSNNEVFPRTAGGTQVEKFRPGANRAAFASGWVPTSSEVVWSVGGKTVTATSTRKKCDTKVSLPADGNGSGPVVALVLSLVIAGGVVLVRRRRLKVTEN
jgi:hypothetical protein